MSFFLPILILFQLGNSTITVEPQDSPAPIVITHGQHDLTLKEVIEALAEFDFKHVEQQPFFRPAYGLTDFSSNPPAIWIFNTSDTTSKRGTVIHELLHVYYHSQHMDPPEEFIASEEERLYQQIFVTAKTEQ